MDQFEKYAMRFLDNVHIYRKPEEEERCMDDILAALVMMSKYGLWHLSVDEIISKWQEYSEKSSAGWLLDCPKQIKEAFNVDVELVPGATEEAL